jgi:hypothetical protein
VQHLQRCSLDRPSERRSAWRGQKRQGCRNGESPAASNACRPQLMIYAETTGCRRVRQQSETAHVRFGSKADTGARPHHVEVVSGSIPALAVFLGPNTSQNRHTGRPVLPFCVAVGLVQKTNADDASCLVGRTSIPTKNDILRFRRRDSATRWLLLLIHCGPRLVRVQHGIHT